MVDFDQDNKINFLLDNAFHLEFKEFPDLSLMITEIDFPGIQFGYRDHPTPNLDYMHQGDTLTYDQLGVTFKIDEYMESYIEIWRWIMALGFPRDTEEFKKMQDLLEPFTHETDATLQILTSKSRPAVEVNFIDLFPVALSPLSFTESVTEPSPVSCTVTFGYSYFTFNNL